jgi:SAM-dependent methyltransferase
MYGDNYGYRSGLNRRMVAHLEAKANSLEQYVSKPSATILDIGSNDGTLLGCFEKDSRRLIGVDPSAEKFRKHYSQGVELYTEFFDADFLNANDFRGQVDLVTSVSMFYDLPDPASFVETVARCLKQNGVWHLEQSYLPLMLETNSFDTVCHEHLEYYSFRVIEELLERSGLEVIELELNKVNGGSIAVTCAHADAHEVKNREILDWVRRSESIMNLSSIEPYEDFARRSERICSQLSELVGSIKRADKRVSGYGASTKGNVTLQYAGLTHELIDVIYEVNEDKFGCQTPGTNIPIVSEQHLLEDSPEYLLVLPWHFRDHVIEKCATYLARGGALIFPLPYVDIVRG